MSALNGWIKYDLDQIIRLTFKQRWPNFTTGLKSLHMGHIKCSIVEVLEENVYRRPTAPSTADFKIAHVS